MVTSAELKRKAPRPCRRPGRPGFCARWLAGVYRLADAPASESPVITAIAGEFDNLRAAWRWAVAAQQIDVLTQLWPGLYMCAATIKKARIG